MEKIKITTKLIISCIIVGLCSLLVIEIIYNRLIYKDYSEMYNQMLIVEDRVDKLIEINVRLQNYIITTKNN